MPAESTLPTYEELSSLVVELSGRLGKALDELAEAKARISDLEVRLGQNSTNSSKPPSSDGLAKPAPKSPREKSGRPPGRPKGQPGLTPRQAPDPDHEVEYRPQGPCAGRGSDLAEAAVAHIERRQVFDPPEHIGLEVTENRILTCRCGFGRAEKAPVPEEVPAAPVRYGPRLAAAGVYLTHGQFLSKDRTAGALADLFDAPVAPGTVASWIRTCATGLDAFGRLVADKVATAPLAFFDETVFRTAGCPHWPHSASTGMFVHLRVRRRRGTEAIDAAGVLPDFTGVATHDAWAPTTPTPRPPTPCAPHTPRASGSRSPNAAVRRRAARPTGPSTHYSH